MEEMSRLSEGREAAGEIRVSVADSGQRPTTHEYGDQLVVVEDAGEVEAHLLLDDGTRWPVSPDSQPGGKGAGLETGLETAASLGLKAFQLRQSESWAREKRARPRRGEAWDFEGGDAIESTAMGGQARSGSEAARAQRRRLGGSVAVGLVVVEGPGDLSFTDEERVRFIAEAQAGLGWLGSLPAEGVRWVYDVQFVTLTIPPGPDDLNSFEKEFHWRHPTMRSLGYSGDDAGVIDYVTDLRTIKQTDFSFASFVTKYPMNRVAYAYLDGWHHVMMYPPGGWGVANIDLVFAHETGHVFGAPDEYAASGCDCGGSYGIGGAPNGNCANCASDGGVECVMSGNGFTMCGFTQRQLGVRPADDAEFVGQSVPRRSRSAAPATARVTMRNTGIADWPAGYKLVARALGWATTQVPIGRVVAPGDSVTVEVSLATLSPGVFDFQWQMATNIATKTFGEATDSVQVTVERDEQQGNPDCAALAGDLQRAEVSLIGWQAELNDAPGPQKAQFQAQIRRVEAEIAAIKRRQRELGCV